MWREWIEITIVNTALVEYMMSPSVWREWIEMSVQWNPVLLLPSPSVWREWIEMGCRV